MYRTNHPSRSFGPIFSLGSAYGYKNNVLKKLVVACTVGMAFFVVACSSSDGMNNSNEVDLYEPVARESHGASQSSSTSLSLVTRSNAKLSIDAQDRSRAGLLENELIETVPEAAVPIAVTRLLNTENYGEIDDNPVLLAAREPTSTFSVDVDTGAYSNVRRFLENGQLPPADAVRIEELINYFNYSYDVPKSPATPFSVTTEFAPSPWNSNRHLLHVGLQGYKPGTSGAARPDANLVFLLDVSGSMDSPDKLGLVKSAIKMVGKQLGSGDSVSIVVYAGATGVVLEPTSGDHYSRIATAIDQLRATGSTNGEAGIKLAYQLAAQAYKEGGINRVILATDGDFNVGVADIEALKDLVARKRQTGIALTTLGFGSGNYNDHLMESLADIGNGSYGYIDNIQEARKVLVEELDATLLTIAKDVKIQVEFNPAEISEYRLIGYVNRRLANEDFKNDKVDAGEIGAGHTVTALYEVALAGRGAELNTPLRYGAGLGGEKADVSANSESDVAEGELLQIRLRYKPVIDSDGELLPEAQTRNSKLIAKVLTKSDIVASIDDASESFRFSSAVAAFGQQLRHGKHTGQFSLNDTIVLAENARGVDKLGYRSAFLQLARLAQSMMPTSVSMDENTDPERDSG